MMSAKSLYLHKDKINYKEVSQKEIELTIFENYAIIKYYKDLKTNRCYQDVDSVSISGAYDVVKKRIKNEIFEENFKNCVLAD